MTEGFAATFSALRPELIRYITRLVVRPSIAEEIVQATAVRALEASSRPDVAELRPWLFRIATNLAIDERRRHGAWRETLLEEARSHARHDPSEVAALRGNPEMAAVAREHLATCFSCTAMQLPAEGAAALLLKEVCGFSNDEIAAILEARFAQVKNWLQSARATMETRYASSCALIHKQGVCHQCIELDGYFDANAGNPLPDRSMKTRLRVLSDAPIGPWTHLLSSLLSELAAR